MAMGGFLGSDPILNASKVAALVKNNTIRYFLLPGANTDGPGALSALPARVRAQLGRAGGFGGGRFGANSAVTAWVQKHCTIVPAARYASVSGAEEALYSCGSGA